MSVKNYSQKFSSKNAKNNRHRRKTIRYRINCGSPKIKQTGARINDIQNLRTVLHVAPALRTDSSLFFIYCNFLGTSFEIKKFTLKSLIQLSFFFWFC